MRAEGPAIGTGERDRVKTLKLRAVVPKYPNVHAHSDVHGSVNMAKLVNTIQPQRQAIDKASLKQPSGNAAACG